MLGRMKQQAEDVCWQLRSAHAAVLEQLIISRAAQLLEGAVDLRGGISHEIGESGRRISGLCLRSKYLLLRVTQPFTAGVGEQPIERGTKMFHVKADRRRTARAHPYVCLLYTSPSPRDS